MTVRAEWQVIDGILPPSRPLAPCVPVTANSPLLRAPVHSVHPAPSLPAVADDTVSDAACGGGMPPAEISLQCRRWRRQRGQRRQLPLRVLKRGGWSRCLRTSDSGCKRGERGRSGRRSRKRKEPVWVAVAVGGGPWRRRHWHARSAVLGWCRGRDCRELSSFYR